MDRLPLSLDSRECMLAAWATAGAALLGWVLMVIGLSGLQHYCQRYRMLYASPVELGAGLGCQSGYSYQWWKVALELFVLVAVIGALFTGRVHIFRVALCALLALVTVLLMDAANTFYFEWRVAPSFTDDASFINLTKTYHAGLIIAAIFNGILILILGTHDETTHVQRSLGLDKEPGRGVGPGSAMHRVGEAPPGEPAVPTAEP